MATQDFDINNTGTDTLNLTGTPKVAVSGSSDFTITVQPDASIAPAGTSTFTADFTPSSVGTKQAVLSIDNDDSDENPYTYNVQGEGVLSAADALNQLLSRSTGMAQQMHITQKVIPWQLLYAANSEATSFATKEPTLTAPVAGDNGIFAPLNNTVKLVFYGTDGDGEAGNVRILGWTKQADGSLYIPTVLVETVLVTFGTSKGVATADIDENQFFADTIDTPSGEHPDVQVVSPTNNLIAWMEVPTFGFAFIEVLFDRTTAASLNGVYSNV